MHDVFVQLAQSPEKVRLRGNLRSFLATCVVNRVRNANKATNCGERAAWMRLKRSPRMIPGPSGGSSPMSDSQANNALAQLPYEQREAVLLHLQAGMKFRDIAKSQGVSINTVQSRYRYGLDKLRSLLDGEV